MAMTRGYIIGAGPQGRVTAETWRLAQPGVDLAFLDDDPTLLGRTLAGLAVVGSVDRLADVGAEHTHVIIAIGSNRARLAIAARPRETDPTWVVVVHPSAVIAESADLGPGTAVMPGAIVATDAVVGEHVIINTGAIVEHDTVIEDGAFLGSGVAMGGRVVVGRGAFVSAGATIAPRITIGAGSIVGAGSVVVKDVPPGVLAYGVPARVVGEIGDDFPFSRLL